MTVLYHAFLFTKMEGLVSVQWSNAPRWCLENVAACIFLASLLFLNWPWGQFFPFFFSISAGASEGHYSAMRLIRNGFLAQTAAWYWPSWVKEAKETQMGGRKPPIDSFHSRLPITIKGTKKIIWNSFFILISYMKQAYLKVTLREKKTMAHTESRSVCATQYFSIHTLGNGTGYLPWFVELETLILSVLYLHIQQIHSIFPPFKSQ